MSSSLAYTPLNEMPTVGEISNSNKNNNLSRQAPRNKNINDTKSQPNSNLNMMKKKINTATKTPAQYQPFNGNEELLADYKPFNPPAKPTLTRSKNNNNNNSINNNSINNNSINNNSINNDEDDENDATVHPDKYDTLDYNLDKLENRLNNTLDNNNNYVKQFSSPASFISKEKKNENVIKNEELLEKLNYMIHLLEEQQDSKTGVVGEEIILYSFLGIFIIFVIDSFARAAKYVR